VEVEIRPEPSPEERAAILTALEHLWAHAEGLASYRSAWRAEAIRENVEDDGDE
jgi:hypothetical protein